MERRDGAGVVINIGDQIKYIGSDKRILKEPNGKVLGFKTKNIRIKWKKYRVERLPQDESDVAPTSLEVIKD